MEGLDAGRRPMGSQNTRRRSEKHGLGGNQFLEIRRTRAQGRWIGGSREDADDADAVGLETRPACWRNQRGLFQSEWLENYFAGKNGKVGARPVHRRSD